MITLNSIFSIIDPYYNTGIDITDEMGFGLLKDFPTCGTKQELAEAIQEFGEREVVEIGAYDNGAMYICLKGYEF